MLSYLGKRLAATVPVVIVVVVFVFLMLRIGDADPAAVIAGENSSAAQIAQVRAHLGLDKPITTQFAIWLSHTATGDLGESFFFKKQVSDLILERLEPTLSLALCTIGLSILIAIPLGILAAYKSGGWIDRMVMGFSALGFSVPVFVIGYVLILVFAVHLGWVPVQGYIWLSDGVGDWFWHLITPSLALSVVYSALIARITRSSIQEVLDEDYIRTARAKGLTNRTVLMRHALRTAAIPIITVIGLGMAQLIGGVVVTESVFSIPGLGRLTVDAVLARDFPTVQALVLLFSLVFVGVNLLVDLSYMLLDPRIKY